MNLVWIDSRDQKPSSIEHNFILFFDIFPESEYIESEESEEFWLDMHGWTKLDRFYYISGGPLKVFQASIKNFPEY